MWIIHGVAGGRSSLAADNPLSYVSADVTHVTMLPSCHYHKLFSFKNFSMLILPIPDSVTGVLQTFTGG